MDHMPDWRVELQGLSMKNIIYISHPYVYKWTERRTRAKLVEAVAVAPDQIQHQLLGAIVRRSRAKSSTQADGSTAGEMPSEEQGMHPSEEEMDDEPTGLINKRRISARSDGRAGDLQIETSNFLCAPQEDVIRSRISNFIDRTQTSALTVVICGVCAREVCMTDVRDQPLGDVPNRHLLQPSVSRPAFTSHLVQGLLLHPDGVVSKSQAPSIRICQECQGSLAKNRLPSFALANGLWVGDVPFALEVLTLPERILIARYFPAVFVVKLFPKRKRGKGFKSECQHSALQGNVSTYRLPTQSITNMVDPDVMPHHPSILPNIIGVTIIGPKNVPERTMKGLFNVRRWRLREALRWLKENNPLYTNIMISETHLLELPDEDVPESLSAIV
jgi:hypothetical protein